MYGITGVFNDPDDEGCGVLEFKQGFNGHAEELAGACTLPTSTIRYKLVEAVHAIKPLKKAGQTEDGR
jgi:alanine adding enzyme